MKLSEPDYFMKKRIWRKQMAAANSTQEVKIRSNLGSLLSFIAAFKSVSSHKNWRNLTAKFIQKPRAPLKIFQMHPCLWVKSQDFSSEVRWIKIV